MSMAFELRVKPGELSARIRTAPYADRGALALSALAAAAVVAAAGASLLFPDALRGPAVTNGQLQGTALVLLLVTLPTLAASIVLAARGVPVAIVFWFGALGSVAYQAVLFLFGTPFNPFFFLYVAMLAFPVWAILALAWQLPIEAIGERVGRRAPVRLVAGYLVVNAALYLLLWLQATVPAVLSGEPPVFLEGTGMTTGPVQIVDFAFSLPLLAWAAWLLLRGAAAGRVLGGALLVMLAIGTTSIGADQWFGHLADPASPASSAALTPVFAALTVVGLVVLGLFLRPGPTER